MCIGNVGFHCTHLLRRAKREGQFVCNELTKTNSLAPIKVRKYRSWNKKAMQMLLPSRREQYLR
jgi:hypothetical protein